MQAPVDAGVPKFGRTASRGVNDCGATKKSVEVRISPRARRPQNRVVTWQSIRLELDRTSDFPNGSAGRAYLLRLPLDAHGSIDEKAILLAPERATMRRFWPNEPDCGGHVRRDGDHWALVSDANGKSASIISEFAPGAIHEGGLLRIRERSGEALPFRVAKMRPLAPRQQAK